MMNKNILLVLSLILMTVGCKDSKVDKSPIPVEESELDDLAPDATLNDVATVYSVLEKNPDYNSLLKLVNQAELFDAIKNLDNVTFFAPTNAAINRLPEDSYNDLRLPSNLERLQSILKYHIVEGEMDAAMLMSTLSKMNGQPYRLKTIQGGFIALTLDESNVISITDENGSIAQISQADIEAANGVIHDIDHVLIPNKN